MANDNQALMDGIVQDVARAQALGLMPDKGNKVSRRGEFKVNPSSIDEDEDRKMRGYRPKPFPKMVRRWGVDAQTGQPGVERTTVADQAALNVALQAGWTTETVTGPPAPVVPVVEPEADGVDVEIPTPRRRRAVN